MKSSHWVFKYPFPHKLKTQPLDNKSGGGGGDRTTGVSGSVGRSGSALRAEDMKGQVG